MGLTRPCAALREIERWKERENYEQLDEGEGEGERKRNWREGGREIGKKRETEREIGTRERETEREIYKEIEMVEESWRARERRCLGGHM